MVIPEDLIGEAQIGPFHRFFMTLSGGRVGHRQVFMIHFGAQAMFMVIHTDFGLVGAGLLV